jgi:hypothetical protein
MGNRQIAQLVREFRKIREPWMESAGRDSLEAAQHVVSINAKIELLLTFWNWTDESVEYP